MDVNKEKSKTAKKDARTNSKNEVGYRKPPKTTQFPPKTSGNPKGRPLGSKNKLPAFGVEAVKTTFLAEIHGEIVLAEGNATVTLPVLTAILQKMIEKAVAGDIRAAQVVFDMAWGIEGEQRREYDRFVRHALIYIKLWQESIDLAERMNVPPPNPVPHPDQFHVNIDTGRLEIQEIILEDEKDDWSSDNDKRKDTEATARWFMTTMKLPPGHDIRNYIRG